MPPEAHGKADGQRLDKMPPLWRDVQHLARLQHTVDVFRAAELWEQLCVRRVHIHLRRKVEESGLTAFRSQIGNYVIAAF